MRAGRRHIRAHLHEHDLTPARIAAEHHVSLRTLYNACGDQDGSRADWIIRQRLERVRRELALSTRAPTISGAARAWGFVSAAHFTRRFRAAYGESPREWLHRSRTGSPPGAAVPATDPADHRSAGRGRAVRPS